MADIELVIKIPEEIYKASQIIDVKYEDVIQVPLEVIANGKPLPKEHGRIGDFDVFLEGFLFDKRADNLECGWIRELIEQATIIEADSEKK